MRLQVFLSHNGVCSRRKAMDMIKDGRVKVNGRVVREPSTPVEPEDQTVLVDGKNVSSLAYDYLMVNKPEGYVTTKADRFAAKTVMDLVPHELRHVHPVGRLDVNTEGLLLLTNDGNLTMKLTHPRYSVEKTYFVRMDGYLTEQDQNRLQKGILLEGKKTAPAAIKDAHVFPAWTEFLLTIHEGRKRQIRLMIKAVGHKVLYLQRRSQGPLSLGRLAKGKWRRLTPAEIKQLQEV